MKKNMLKNISSVSSVPVIAFLIIGIIQLAASVAFGQSPPVRYDDLPDAGEYTIDGRKWNHTNITYYFQNGTFDINGDEEQAAVREAFRLWSIATRLTFTQVSSAGQADIVILWATGNHGDGLPFDGINGVLAHAFYPPPNGGSLAGDVHFDDAEFWTTDTRADSGQPIDLVTVAAHEIGHSLGLGHSTVPGALMEPYYTGSHRYLAQDDVDGIRYLYPLPPFTRFEPTDYDGDNRADFAVFTPNSGVWQRIGSSSGLFPAVQFGSPGDIPVSGDYNGDRRADITVFRPSSGIWYILQNAPSDYYGVQFGQSGDKPVPGDYDRDGKTDVAVWRPSDGTWYIRPSSTERFYGVQLGSAGDKPVPGDYDGDGYTDVAVWRPSDRVWYIRLSSTGQITYYQFGLSDDKPVPGDYDGDGKTDIAVWRPVGINTEGNWYIVLSSTGQFYSFQFGSANDIPVASDFDGDGKTDGAVWRPSTGVWYVLPTTTNQFYGVQLGTQGDIPVSATLPQ